MQGTLEGALRTLRRDEVSVTVAGRTDAGVHALGQVASHPGERATASALNGVLPPDVRVLRSELAEDGFDARRYVLSRTYRYRVVSGPVARVFERGRALHWKGALDRATLDSCAALLPGMHDFTAFTPTQTEHVRFERDVLRAEWLDEGPDLIAFWIEADTFMRHMVRTLVGTMLGVAAGRMELEDFERLLGGRPRSEAGDTAAACGLYLESVRY